MQQPIVTLTTDWGDSDFFSGMVKGTLLRLANNVQIVDIAHHVPPFNIATAAFIVANTCPAFPDGTIHIIDIASQQPLIAFRSAGHYYLCSDNGLPTLAFGSHIEDARLLDVPPADAGNFPALTILTPVAAALLAGHPLGSVGKAHTALLQRTLQQGWVQQGDNFIIYIRHIDHYGNAYLGMTYDQFESLRDGRSFVLKVKEHAITQLTYSYTHPDTAHALQRRLRLTVSATGLLELSHTSSSLQQTLGFRVNDGVVLSFKA